MAEGLTDVAKVELETLVEWTGAEVAEAGTVTAAWETLAVEEDATTEGEADDAMTPGVTSAAVSALVTIGGMAILAMVQVIPPSAVSISVCVTPVPAPRVELNVLSAALRIMVLSK